MRRLLLILALLLLAVASEASAVTRMYLKSRLPDVYPTQDGAWTTTGERKWRGLEHTSATLHGSINVGYYPNPTDITGDTLDYIYVSAPMDSGIVFQSGVTTVKMWLALREYNSTDNVDRCVIGIRVLDQAGTTVQATLLAVSGSYGTTTEFTDEPTASNGTARKCADGDTITADYTTVTGDRIVLELGYAVSGSGTTPQAGAAIMNVANGRVDCPETEGSSSGAMYYSWIEFSNTITFQGFDRVAAILRYNRSYAMPIANNVAFDAGWETTTSAGRGRLDHGINGTTADAQTGMVPLTEDNSTTEGLHRQFVSLPMAAGIVFDNAATRVTITANMNSSGTGTNLNRCVTGLRVVTEDGTTVQATLFSVASRDIGSPYGHADADNAPARTCVENVFVTNDYTTSAGDRLVLEIGCGTTSSTTGAECNFSMGDSNYFDDTIGDVLWDCPPAGTQSECVPTLNLYGITFAVDPEDAPGPTRLYFAERTATIPRPAVDASWNESNETQYRRLSVVKGGSQMQDGQLVDTTDDSTFMEVDRQFISQPMTAGAVFEQGWTTIKGQIMGRRLAGTDGKMNPAVSVRIIASDFSTVRVELLSADEWFYTDVNHLVNDTVPFMSATTMTNTVLFSPTTPVAADYTTVAGDRLVVEIGAQTGNANTTPQFQFRYGENATDCVEMNTTSTTSCAGWIEFSNEINFEAFTDVRAMLPWIFKYL